MTDHTLTMPDGRAVGFATYGPADGTPVVWCHGGPGSRLEPAAFEPFLEMIGLRVIGIDRPGYGLSSLRPGRTIADWVPDCVAVADHLGIERFLTVGVSTGGAYALATAALVPDRVRGVLLCCAMTDMRDQLSRGTMSVPHCHAVWNAPDRDAALAAAVAAFGEDGSKLFDPGNATLCEADREFVAGMDPADPAQAASLRAQFANGVQGYVDDRRADGPGWVSFHVGVVRCPVTVIHGADDTIVSPLNATHTVSLLPQATLHIRPGHGHLSVTTTIVEPLLELAAVTA